jgi:hypothetical protein
VRGGVPLARRVLECIEEALIGWNHRGDLARRGDSENLRLGIEESKTRLPTGRKGAVPTKPSVRLRFFPVVQSRHAFPRTTARRARDRTQALS